VRWVCDSIPPLAPILVDFIPNLVLPSILADWRLVRQKY
jgi:hypothetical protein